METKILKAVFGGGRYAVTTKRTRTDYGQVLEFVGIDLPDTFECIFSNSDTYAGVGKKQIGSAQRVLIPDEYLQTGQTIYAWVLVHDSENDGRHMYNVKIPVADMPDTSPEEPTPVEQSVISQAIAALNTAVDTTTQKASEASESASRAEQAAEGVESYAERAETAQQAAEDARDRAEQAETSASASATTATTKASEALSSATAASQSVIDAEQESERARLFAESSAQSAQGASQFAVNAGGSAYSASESAQEASGYARNASASAETASQKASEASQSAQTASQAKTDAITAKTASETAQGLAERAKADAISAKEDAESARDEAQSIADSITGKVEQIDSNSSRIESLEDDRYKPYAVDTASGAVASFSDGADDIPLKSCIVQVEPVQAGSGDPSPDNVRPISGFTGCEVVRNSGDYAVFGVTTGKTLNTAGEAVNESGMGVSDWMPVNTGDTVTLKYVSTKAGRTRRVIGYDANKAFVSILSSVSWADVGQEHTQTVTVESGVKYIRASFYVNDTDKSFINESSVTTYPITFPASAGTVYGGYVDVTGGELVVDRAYSALNNPDKWYETSGTANFRYNVPFDSRKIYDDSYSGLACSYVPCLYGAEPYGRWNSASGTEFCIKSSALTLERVKADAEAGKISIVYELDTPIHYPLTPTKIKTLLGVNNVWADTGDTEVEYRADTRLYIEKLTQPEEDDMVADSAITNGKFFMIGNTLYRALANIASGATITVGTNAERVSLSDALNLVNA